MVDEDIASLEDVVAEAVGRAARQSDISVNEASRTAIVLGPILETNHESVRSRVALALSEATGIENWEVRVSWD